MEEAVFEEVDNQMEKLIKQIEDAKEVKLWRSGKNSREYDGGMYKNKRERKK